jgi:hypothetical protein
MLGSYTRKTLPRRMHRPTLLQAGRHALSSASCDPGKRRRMIRTQDQGGMSALIRMANLMKKGQQAETKSVDYSDEVKDINDMLKKQGK